MNLQQDVEKRLMKLTHRFLAEAGELKVIPVLSPESSLQNHLGLDSLGRAELFSRLEKEFGIELSADLLAQAETLQDLIQAIQAAKPGRAAEKSEQTRANLQEPAHLLHDWSRLKNIDTLQAILDYQARGRPEQIYVYLQTDTGEERLSFHQLKEQALKVAAFLLKRGLNSGETVALMLPTQLEFFYAFFGILYAGGIPVPIYPPLRPQQLESYAKQEARILKNAEIRFLFTFEQAEGLSRLLKAFVPSLKAVLTVTQALRNEDPFHSPSYNTSDIALLQYTSGSTGTPKGVALSHHNLLSNIRAFGQAIEVTPSDIAVSWLPLYHDFGLIGLVMGTLYYGLPLILMSPLTFLARPEKWLWAIHHYRGTVTAAPNFAYELCARKLGKEQLDGLDLSSWRFSANGAETVYPQTYRRFLELLQPYGYKPETFLPVYGLAESTVGLAVSPIKRPPRIDRIERQAFEEEKRALPLSNDSKLESLEFISCGKALPGHHLRIVDEKQHACPERFVGEVEFKGPSTMQGYYNNPEATRAIQDKDWWKTGDYAYMADDELFVTGRKKDLIIKAGRNLYPSVIEEQVSELAGLRRGCAIAFGIHDTATGTDKLVIVAETLLNQREAKKDLQQRLQERLASTLDLAADEIILVPPRTVPKTSSGKLQRSACKALYQQGRLKPAPAWWQLSRLGLRSLLLRGGRLFFNALKALYTLYLVLLILITMLPYWLLIQIVSVKAAGVLTQKAARILRVLALCSLEVKGREHLSTQGPLIYIANHASYIDALVLIAILPPKARLVGKKEIFSLPLLGSVLRKLQYLPVDRLDFTQGLAQTRQLEVLLQHGQMLALFPEGTFSYAAGLRSFKLGAFKIATETGTPLCPLALQGTRQILRSGSYLLRPGKITCTIGHALHAQGKEWQDLMELKNQARAFISEHCGEASLDFSAQEKPHG